MNEQELPFEENAIVPEMEYAIWEQEESTIFPAYRNDEKLIPRQGPRQSSLPLALIPIVIVLAFLLFSYVAGYAFYAHNSFNSWHQNGQFYDGDQFDHHRFPQKQFDQPGPPSQPIQPKQSIQPSQQKQAGQPVHMAPGTTPRIMIRHSSG
jgi:hypothetical protein